jgi:hypothetical protein
MVGQKVFEPVLKSERTVSNHYRQFLQPVSIDDALCSCMKKQFGENGR